MTSIFKHVKRDIIIRTTPERVWSALTDPQERNRWETRHCEIDLEIGGQITLDYGWGVSYKGTIVELVPPHKLTLKGEDEELTIWTITPHAEGSLVSIEYTGLWSNEREYMMMDNMAFGTYRFMRNMKSVLEGQSDLRPTFWSSWIGVNHYTYRDNGIEGVKVLEVFPNTTADGVIEIGDIIIRADSEVIHEYDEFEDKVTSMTPGEEIAIEFVRHGTLHRAVLLALPYGLKKEIEA
ncbi:SRPBCC domain-containing protein [Paenibacillus solani]|uniref:SRPBCC domain-containing protein n=1 Tax=Paenibacillus solani TaxID=1705565 RepID=UPI003D2AC293